MTCSPLPAHLNSLGAAGDSGNGRTTADDLRRSFPV
ncbi:hypothetical protein SFR_3608 [Streptomyces sp. FR-008]|nr:hypothetical protein SFR_3608 [Streptomyces sp. FR-008]